MTSNTASVGQVIRRLREAQGTSLSELAKTAGVSKGYIHALENGTTGNPTLDTLKKISDALGVTVADLLDSPKARQVVPETLPEPLEELVWERKKAGKPLDAATIASLAGMQFRGQKPRTLDAYRALLYTLETSVRDDD